VDEDMSKKKINARGVPGKKERRKRQAKKEVRERHLRRWNGTRLEVKTLSQMWVHQQPWHFNPPATAFSVTGAKTSSWNGPLQFDVSVEPISTSY
jgi:hypothetical protein